MKQGSSVGYWDGVWIEFKKDSLAYVSFFFIVLLTVTAVFESFLAGNKPIVLVDEGKYYFPVIVDYPEFRGEDLRATYLDDPDSFAVFPPVKYSPTESDFFSVLAAPDGNHFLGTDDRGRDVLSRMIHGARISLSIGVVAVGIAMVIGIILGAMAGYYGGWIDFVISRLIEVMITFPVFFLILTILAFTEPSIYNIMIVIGITGWTGVARLLRGEFLKLRRTNYVEAAWALGSGDRRIILKHMLPNALAPVLVSATFGVAGAILVESSLSFLGFGVTPPEPSWGEIISQSQKYVDFAWWLVLFPGFAIFATVTALNLVGEGFRNAIDPKLKER